MNPCIDHGRKDARYTTTSVDGYTVGLHVKVYCDENGLHPLCFRGTGKVVRHTCDNARCIEPTHLIQGSVLDNIADRDARGRTSKGEKHYAAKLSDDEVKQIRALYVRRSIEFGSVALGKRFGVSHRMIIYIIHGANRNA